MSIFLLLCTQCIQLQVSFLCNGFDEICSFDITLAKTTHIVCGEGDLHFVVHIKPFGMMVGFVGIQCHTGHESKGLK